MIDAKALDCAVSRFRTLIALARFDGWNRAADRPTKTFVGHVINAIPAIRAEYRRVMEKEVGII